MHRLAVWSSDEQTPSWVDMWRDLGHDAALVTQPGEATTGGFAGLILPADLLGDPPAAGLSSLGLQDSSVVVIAVDASPVQVAALAPLDCVALAGPLDDGVLCDCLVQVLSAPDDGWAVGDAQVFLNLREVRRDGAVFALSEQEAGLLQLLWQADGRVVSRDDLYRQVWGYRSRPRGRALDFAVFRLRSKLESDPSQPRSLLTVRGAGFRLERGQQAEAAVDATRVERSLPSEPDTAYVGRQDELGEVQCLLADGGRLLTIAGPGGAGKTRLALRVAAREQEGGHWPGGLRFVDLAEVTTAAGAVRAVAQSLDLSLKPGLALDQAVAQIAEAAVAGGRMLWILDNCEQAVDAIRPLVATWIAGPDAVSIVCTSRISLRLPEERLIEIGALPEAQAAELFVQRARAVRPGFSSAADDVHVRDVVRELGGLPLALELAGACLRLLSVGQLKGRLDRHLDLLRGAGHRPARHHTLRATLDWSWELLSEPARRALATVSVFRGPFDLGAAAAVLAGGDDLRAIEELSELVDHHLVAFDERTEPPQFVLLPSVRAYAQERLDGDRERAFEARSWHAEWFARDGDPQVLRQLRGRAGIEIGQRLGRHFDNLLAALSWSVSAGESGWAVACLAALQAYALVVGGPVELPLTASEPLLGQAVPARRRCALFRHRAVLLWLHRDNAGALACIEAAVEVGSSLSAEVRADLAFQRGRILGSLTRVAEARQALERARALAPDGWTAARSLRALGFQHLVLGEFERGEAVIRRGLERARVLGDLTLEARLLADLSEVQRKQGRFDEAWENNSAALALCESLGQARQQAGMLGNRGGIAFLRGQLDEAEALLRSSIALLRSLGDRRNLAVVMVRLAWVRVFQGCESDDEIDGLGQRGVDLALSIGDVLLHGVMRGSWAELQLFRGDAEVARRVLLGASDPLAELGIPLVSFMSWCTWAGAFAELGQVDEATEAVTTAWRFVDHVQSPLTLALSLARLSRAAAAIDHPLHREIEARLVEPARQMAGHPALVRLRGATPPR